MKKQILRFFLAAVLLLSLGSCKKEPEPEPKIELTRQEKIQHNKEIDPEEIQLLQLWMPTTGDPIAIVETNLGSLYFVLYPEEAPLAVENFTTHAENGFFDDSVFYKVIENFYIQSGAPSGIPQVSIFTEKNEPVGFPNEISSNLWHFRGALVMDNGGEAQPDSNTSEFFVVQAKTIKEEWFEEMEEIGYPEKVIEEYRSQGGIPGYDTHFTVFGQLYAGYEVLDAIGETPVDSTYLPIEKVQILGITIDTYNSEAPVPPLEKKEKAATESLPIEEEKETSESAA